MSSGEKELLRTDFKAENKSSNQLKACSTLECAARKLKPVSGCTIQLFVCLFEDPSYQRKIQVHTHGLHTGQRT